MKSSHQNRPGIRLNFWPNLFLTLLVAGVPLGIKLVLQNARAATSQQVEATEPMVVPRRGHTATVLTNGTVLIAGGLNSNNAALASAEIYEPTNRTFTAAGEMAAARVGHTATLLGDGRVLVAGGQNARPLDSAEIFRPATN